MTIDQIFTDRLRRMEGAVWMRIIYEWEDDLCEALGATLRHKPAKPAMALFYTVPQLYRWLFRGSRHILSYEDAAIHDRANILNDRRSIPWIVDWWVPQEGHAHFAAQHDRVPLILISSREAYDIARQALPQLPIKHLALALSDRWKFDPDSLNHKRYDCIEMGRGNTLLHSFMLQYAERHPSFIYIYRELAPGFKNLYFSNRGEELGDMHTREQYMGLMRQCRVGLYAAAGCETGDYREEFGHVTPRLLEYLSQGCHVLAHYKRNADTDWWGLPSLCPDVADYDTFEREMDKALATPVDPAERQAYMQKHYMSTRIGQLREILAQL